MKKTYKKDESKCYIFATTAQGFGAPPVYTIVQYPVSELEITGICMKKS